jgi:putative hydrolase of the HAD superfamily
MQTILFFDLDSTLVENRFSQKIVTQLLTPVSVQSGLTIRELAQALGEENTRRQMADPDNPLTMDWQDILQTIASRYNVTLEDVLDDLWVKNALAEDIEVLDEAHAVLAKLKAYGRHLVIATKGLSKYQLPVLQAVGLLDLFHTILTPDRTGFLKTTAAYFDAYRREHPAELYVHIGDHYFDDVICAKRNGFASVLRAPLDELREFDPFERPAHIESVKEEIKTYPEEGTTVVPDAVIVSLQELPEVVERLEQRAAQQTSS